MPAINEKKIEKLREYLTLFGLDEDFSIEELSASYRTLAKLNHPDIVQNDISEEIMVLINEGHDFLKKIFESGEIHSLKTEKRDKGKEDIFYNQYKKAFTILKNTFEVYFGEGEEKKLFRDEKYLKENLHNAKAEFSKLVNDLPYSEWVDDAIDKISSINKWLK